MRSREQEGARRRSGVSFFPNAADHKKPLRAVGSIRRKKASPRASVTVEAAIALPLYLFFFVNILTAFDILRMQCDLTAALHQTGNHIAFHAFDLKYADDAIDYLTGTEAGGPSGSVLGDAGTLIYSAVYVEGQVREYLGEEYLDHSCIRDGAGGISYLRSRIMMQADEIELVASYRVKPFFPGLIAFKDFPMEARYFGHAWTGYEPGGAGGEIAASDDPIVYITETGTVYHRNLNCQHLKHAVRCVPAAEAVTATNNSGQHYTPCEICGGYGNGQGTAYISDGGDRIHSTVNCPGLKRTIYHVHLSEVGGRPPCSICGGE